MLKFILFICFMIVFQLTEIDARVCTERQMRWVNETEDYPYSYKTANEYCGGLTCKILYFPEKGVIIRKTFEKYKAVIVKTCCPGFKNINESRLNNDEPVCRPICIRCRGTCVAPFVCEVSPDSATTGGSETQNVPAYRDNHTDTYTSTEESVEDTLNVTRFTITSPAVASDGILPVHKGMRYYSNLARRPRLPRFMEGNIVYGNNNYSTPTDSPIPMHSRIRRRYNQYNHNSRSNNAPSWNDYLRPRPRYYGNHYYSTTTNSPTTSHNNTLPWYKRFNYSPTSTRRPSRNGYFRIRPSFYRINNYTTTTDSPTTSYNSSSPWYQRFNFSSTSTRGPSWNGYDSPRSSNDTEIWYRPNNNTTSTDPISISNDTKVWDKSNSTILPKRQPTDYNFYPRQWNGTVNVTTSTTTVRSTTDYYNSTWFRRHYDSRSRASPTRSSNGTNVWYMSNNGTTSDTYPTSITNDTKIWHNSDNKTSPRRQTTDYNYYPRQWNGTINVTTTVRSTTDYYDSMWFRRHYDSRSRASPTRSSNGTNIRYMSNNGTTSDTYPISISNDTKIWHNSDNKTSPRRQTTDYNYYPRTWNGTINNSTSTTTVRSTTDYYNSTWFRRHYDSRSRSGPTRLSNGTSAIISKGSDIPATWNNTINNKTSILGTHDYPVRDNSNNNTSIFGIPVGPVSGNKSINNPTAPRSVNWNNTIHNTNSTRAPTFTGHGIAQNYTTLSPDNSTRMNETDHEISWARRHWLAIFSLTSVTTAAVFIGYLLWHVNSIKTRRNHVHIQDLQRHNQGQGHAKYSSIGPEAKINTNYDYVCTKM